MWRDVCSVYSGGRGNDRVLRVRAGAKWIRSAHQLTLWPDKLQEGWTRCPTEALLWLTHADTHSATGSRLQIKCMYSNVSAGAQTYTHAAIREQRKRECAIMQKRDGNNNGTSKRRCLALRPSLSGVCSNQAQPHLADGMNQLQRDCLHSQSNMSFFTLETRGHPIFTAQTNSFFIFQQKLWYIWFSSWSKLSPWTVGSTNTYRHNPTQRNHLFSQFPSLLC